MRRQVTRNALDNSGDGALTMVPLCRELSGTGDHTRKTMEVKRTSWGKLWTLQGVLYTTCIYLMTHP